MTRFLSRKKPWYRKMQRRNLRKFVHTSKTKKILRPLSNMDRHIFKYRQYIYTTTITQGNAAAGDTLGTLAMILQQCNNDAAFSDLYDQYRIDYLEFTFYPTTTLADLADQLGPAVPPVPALIYTVVDRDDQTTPVNLAELYEYQTIETHNTGQQFTLRFKPGTVGTMVNAAGTQVAARNEISPWLDIAQNTIRHYGVKYGITAGAASQLGLSAWRVDLYAGLSFKYIR